MFRPANKNRVPCSRAGFLLSTGGKSHMHDHVDDLDVLERGKTCPALHSALLMIRLQHCRGTGITSEGLFNLASNDGIPAPARSLTRAGGHIRSSDQDGRAFAEHTAEA